MPQPRPYDEDWTGVNEQVALRILEQGEIFLEAQLKLAVAADQRAMVSANILSAAAAALLAAGLHFLLEKSGNETLGKVALAMAADIWIAAGFCFVAARPLPFGLAGSMPVRLWPHRLVLDQAEVLGGEAENYQMLIDKNQRTLANNGRLLRFGMAITFATPLIGLAAWFISTHPNLGVGCC